MVRIIVGIVFVLELFNDDGKIVKFESLVIEVFMVMFVGLFWFYDVVVSCLLCRFGFRWLFIGVMLFFFWLFVRFYWILILWSWRCLEEVVIVIRMCVRWMLVWVRCVFKEWYIFVGGDGGVCDEIIGWMYIFEFFGRFLVIICVLLLEYFEYIICGNVE